MIDCLADIRSSELDVPLIASGGIRNGLAAAKAIALGADLVGFAFLQAATTSPEAVQELVDVLRAELTTTLFCTGSWDVAVLRREGVLQRC